MSLKYGGDSPLATDRSWPTKGTNPDSPPFVTAPRIGVIWEKPDASLTNKRAAFFADGGPPFAPTHRVAAVPADRISETSIWSCSFERTSK